MSRPQGGWYDRSQENRVRGDVCCGLRHLGVVSDMIRFVEVIAFLLASASAYARFFDHTVAYVSAGVLAVVMYAFAYARLRHDETASEHVRGIYLNNLCIMVLAPIFCLYRHGAFVIGCLMLIAAAIVAVRSLRMPDGHPTTHGFFRGV